MTPPYRALVVSGVRLFCEGLAQRLAGTSLAVVDVATTWPVACELVRRLHPDVVLIDASSREFLPHVAALREVAHAHVVAFAVEEDEGAAIACAEAGVSAFVERSASIEDLVAAVERGVRGELQLSPRMAGALFRRLGARRHPAPALPRGARLTAREREIFLMLQNRMTNKEIAVRLGLRLSTVKNHVHHLLEKLGVHRRNDAVTTARD